MKKIAVLGTGYVGLVSGTCFAEIGHHVTCCDINEAKIRSLQNGVIPIYEPGLEELAEKNVSAGRLSFTADIEPAVKAADIIYIAVGTPMSKTGEADLTYIFRIVACVKIRADGLRKFLGCLRRPSLSFVILQNGFCQRVR